MNTIELLIYIILVAAGGISIGYKIGYNAGMWKFINYFEPLIEELTKNDKV